MRWISVKDRLPKTGIDVLVSNGKSITIGYYCVKEFWKEVFNNDSINVYYWMPLPKPPREE